MLLLGSPPLISPIMVAIPRHEGEMDLPCPAGCVLGGGAAFGNPAQEAQGAGPNQSATRCNGPCTGHRPNAHGDGHRGQTGDQPTRATRNGVAAPANPGAKPATFRPRARHPDHSAIVVVPRLKPGRFVKLNADKAKLRRNVFTGIGPSIQR